MKLGRAQDNPLVPLHSRMRVFDPLLTQSGQERFDFAVMHKRSLAEQENGRRGNVGKRIQGLPVTVRKLL